MASAEEEGRRLFVGGLNGATTDATFRAHFASFFPVANAEVSKHIYVSNPSIILRFTGTPTKSSKYKKGNLGSRLSQIYVPNIVRYIYLGQSTST